MFKGLSKLYKGFKKEVWLDENSGQYHCEKYDFIIDISPIEFNKFGEVWYECKHISSTKKNSS